MDEALAGLQAELLRRAEEHADALMPGFTHLQTAQPVFGFTDGLCRMFGRDRGVLPMRARLNESQQRRTAGTGFPTDRQMTASFRALNGRWRTRWMPSGPRLRWNSCLRRHLCGSYVPPCRRNGDLVFRQFSFIALSDAFTTGSSIVPQKRSDAAELVRAKLAGSSAR